MFTWKSFLCTCEHADGGGGGLLYRARCRSKPSDDTDTQANLLDVMCEEAEQKSPVKHDTEAAVGMLSEADLNGGSWACESASAGGMRRAWTRRFSSWW